MADGWKGQAVYSGWWPSRTEDQQTEKAHMHVSNAADIAVMQKH